MKTKRPKRKRGFAAMKAETQLAICTMGGLTVSKRKGWMARLGRKGGTNKHRNARRAKARKDSND